MKVIERILSVLAPEKCVQCGLESELLCSSCISEYVNSAIPTCYRCNAVSDGFATCKACYRSSALRAVFVASEYENGVKKIIAEFKYSQARHAKSPLATLITGVLPYFAAEEEVLLCPIPTARKRVRRRGFDHAVLLASEVAKRKNVQSVEALGRIGDSRQVGASRSQRIEQINDSFYMQSGKSVEGRAVYLIDDVSTTGATLEAAAAVLKGAGARVVYGGVVARG